MPVKPSFAPVALLQTSSAADRPNLNLKQKLSRSLKEVHVKRHTLDIVRSKVSKRQAAFKSRRAKRLRKAKLGEGAMRKRQKGMKGLRLKSHRSLTLRQIKARVAARKMKLRHRKQHTTKLGESAKPNQEKLNWGMKDVRLESRRSKKLRKIKAQVAARKLSSVQHHAKLMAIRAGPPHSATFLQIAASLEPVKQKLAKTMKESHVKNRIAKQRREKKKAASLQRKVGAVKKAQVLGESIPGSVTGARAMAAGHSIAKKARSANKQITPATKPAAAPVAAARSVHSAPIRKHVASKPVPHTLQRATKDYEAAGTGPMSFSATGAGHKTAAHQAEEYARNQVKLSDEQVAAKEKELLDAGSMLAARRGKFAKEYHTFGLVNAMKREAVFMEAHMEREKQETEKAQHRDTVSGSKAAGEVQELGPSLGEADDDSALATIRADMPR